MKDLSLIVPTHNEEKNVKALIQRAHVALTEAKISYEIIFIDDHSVDKTREIVRDLASEYPVKLYLKKGKKGKAFSILEGTEIADSPYVVMLDSDLQYPPEVIPDMYKKKEKYGVVVANRKTYKSTVFRKIASRMNRFLFGKFMFGIEADIQSGLKLFHKEIIEHVDKQKVSAWSLDIPLLFTALELGFTLGSVNITFERRKGGESKISYLSTIWQIVTGALSLKFAKKRVYMLPSKNGSMKGAGLVHQRKRYVTHTNLPHHQSALETFARWQTFTIFLILGMLVGGLLIDALTTAIVTIGLLSSVYFIDVLFSFYLLLKSLHAPPEIVSSTKELNDLDKSKLPTYSILCPLYKEAHIVPQFVDALSTIDWPKDKLEVLLLLEEDDKDTIEKVGKLDLPSYIRVIIVPDSQPKTKPKACNYGLAFAKGEYVVIYDAEDIPDPYQLKKAYIAFQRLPKNIICLQAKLNYYNPHHNLLTRLFTAEYSLWFDVILPGLQSIETNIPLGGTSNHFRTEDLKKLQAWDPFNVTEDCDLGIRLFKKGYKTAIIDSTTLEEATSRVGNWLRQRSRWLKGYLQTYFVHMRNPYELVRTQGVHALIFQLVVGGKIAFMVINPILWILTISYFALYRIVGPAIEAVYPTYIFYMAATSLVFGNFMYLYNYMIGTAKRGHYSVIKYIYLVPIYWLMVSIGACIAFFQLIFKPHYWEKTHHGFHLKKNKATSEQKVQPETQNALTQRVIKFKKFALSEYASGGFLIATSIVGNFFNFLYNTYLGRHLSIEDFGLISLISSFLYLSSIPLGGLTKTITYRSAYLLGKYNVLLKDYWVHSRKKTFYVSLIIAGLWMMIIPLLSRFFHAEHLMPFLLFTPVWLVGTTAAVDSGFLTGNLKFYALSILMLVESISKFTITYTLVNLGLSDWVYSAVPLSITISFFVGWLIISRYKTTANKLEGKIVKHFPKKFFVSSILTKISTVAFLSMDVILAKHYLSPIDAGKYAYLSLIGKMIYFMGGLFGQFLAPIVSRNEGAGKDSKKSFYALLLSTVFISLLGFVIVGFFGHITVPILFGKKASSIIEDLPLYTLSMAYFTISTTIVTYHQNRGNFLFPYVTFFLTLAQIGGIILYHGNLIELIGVMQSLGLVYLLVISILHIFFESLVKIEKKSEKTIDAFIEESQQNKEARRSLRILIYNWRDTKHVWAGGAETYIQELAKRWAKSGHQVTIFCGNDRRNKTYEKVEGVRIIRRGGFFTVYIWAFLYYVLKLNGKYDVVIDSENGVPFFTPLYVNVPKFLLIHHVHQDVFREHLHFPFSIFAGFIETKLMPLIYRGVSVITVSESSRIDIQKLKITAEENIYVVSPGIDEKYFVQQPKTQNPTFLYLGRLKPYKNIDVAIRAFGEILPRYPEARFLIAGEGESVQELQKLVSDSQIGHAVSFLGKVPESEKIRLLAKSWAALQPSSFEGWGLSVIEANAAGTPVIASNVNGLKDSVVHEKTGILVPLKRIRAFADSMETMINYPKMKNSLSQEAVKWAKEFSWEDSADKFYRIIEYVSNTPHPRIGFGKINVISQKYYEKSN